jgi:nucleoid-associated protein YgaU
VSPPPAASVAAPAPGSIADQAAPAAVLPGAPGATLPPAQVSGRAQPKETLAPAPQRPSQGQTTPLRQPAPAAQVVRERVRVITIVYPPPDFSDPFVHIRGTQFDPAVLAQGGPAVPPPPSRRQVTVREVIVTTPASPVRPAQPSSPVQTAPARPGRTYVVAPNDTLTAIAQRFYNNADLWMRIYDANRAVLGNNPNAIPAGVRILIP